MDVQDLSHNLRLASLKKLTRALEQSQTPEQTMQALQRGFTEAHGFVASMLLLTRGLGKGQYRVIQIRLKENQLDNVPEGFQELNKSIHSGGMVATIIGRAEPQLIQEVDWSSDPSFNVMLRGYASVIAIPFAGDHVPISWVILMKRAPEQFTVADLEEAVQRVALSGSLLESQVLAGKLTRANERIDRDARQVGQLQRALLPESPPRIAGLEVAVSYEPSGRAGGDVYDFFALDERYDDQTDESAGDRTGDNVSPNRWCIFIGDAAGHGLAAAVVMAIVQAVLHAHPAGIARPASLLAHANRQLCRKRIGGFVTAFLGIYEPATRRLTYSNAGHPRPLLRRRSVETVCALDAVASYPLGIEPSQSFKEAVVQFEPGDTLLLYTDGITEARNPGGEQFELDGLKHVLQSGSDHPADLIARLRQALRAHEDQRSSEDDQTLVAARVL